MRVNPTFCSFQRVLFWATTLLWPIRICVAICHSTQYQLRPCNSNPGNGHAKLARLFSLMDPSFFIETWLSSEIALIGHILFQQLPRLLYYQHFCQKNTSFDWKAKRLTESICLRRDLCSDFAVHLESIEVSIYFTIQLSLILQEASEI